MFGRKTYFRESMKDTKAFTDLNGRDKNNKLILITICMGDVSVKRVLSSSIEWG